MKPKTYREQVTSSCGNCKHCFIKRDYDEGEEFLCHIDKSERPLCGSALLEESFFSTGPESTDYEYEEFIYKENSDAWDKWSEPRQVSESGICDSWSNEPDIFENTSNIVKKLANESDEMKVLREQSVESIEAAYTEPPSKLSKLKDFGHLAEELRRNPRTALDWQRDNDMINGMYKKHKEIHPNEDF